MEEKQKEDDQRTHGNELGKRLSPFKIQVRERSKGQRTSSNYKVQLYLKWEKGWNMMNILKSNP